MFDRGPVLYENQGATILIGAAITARSEPMPAMDRDSGRPHATTELLEG